MKRAESIFDSFAERRLWAKLNSRWSEIATLYPQLPLTKLLKLEGDERLTHGEHRCYIGTNVDYTFCEGQRPILSIEFDGIGGGFNRCGVYTPIRETTDPYRALKMNFKLRKAKEAGYPFVVVSYDETRPIGGTDSLMILDSIIGQFYASRRFHERWEEQFEETNARLQHLPAHERAEAMSDAGLDMEIGTEFKFDPLARLAAEAEHDFYFPEGIAHGFGRVVGRHYHRSMIDPEPKPIRLASGLTMLPAEALNDAHRIGCDFCLETDDGPIREQVWVRNIELPGVWAGTIAENLARFRCFQRALSQHADAA